MVTATRPEGRLRDKLLEVGAERFMAALSPKEKLLLPYAWREIWARDSQLEPPGEWLTWLLMTGRGYGKTRAWTRR